MAVTLSVRDALTYVSTLLNNQQLEVNGLQPGLTTANIVLQRMLGAPFIWRFNRKNFSIALIPTGQRVEQIQTKQLSASAGVQSITMGFAGTDIIPVGKQVAFAGLVATTSMNGNRYAVTASSQGSATFVIGSGSVNEAFPNPETGTATWQATAQTDYVVSVPTLGRIETQWIVDPSGKIWELKGSQSIPSFGNNTGAARPVEVAPVYDDNQGNITFRFNKIPDQAYVAYFDYQQKAPLITGYGDTFFPVADEFGYLYNKGVLAEAALLTNDSRFPIWEKDFIAGLLATQDGLDAQAKDIFYNQMLNTGRTGARSQSLAQSGGQGRQQ